MKTRAWRQLLEQIRILKLQLAHTGFNLLDSNCPSKYQCCSGSVQDRHQKNIPIDCNSEYPSQRPVFDLPFFYTQCLLYSIKIKWSEIVIHSENIFLEIICNSGNDKKKASWFRNFWKKSVIRDPGPPFQTLILLMLRV